MTAWLTVAEIAEAEKVSARTILRWIEQGHLRARRQPGGRLRIHVDWYAELTGEGRILAGVRDAEEANIA